MMVFRGFERFCFRRSARCSLVPDLSGTNRGPPPRPRPHPSHSLLRGRGRAKRAFACARCRAEGDRLPLVRWRAHANASARAAGPWVGLLDQPPAGAQAGSRSTSVALCLRGCLRPPASLFFSDVGRNFVGPGAPPLLGKALLPKSDGGHHGHESLPGPCASPCCFVVAISAHALFLPARAIAARRCVAPVSWARSDSGLCNVWQPWFRRIMLDS